MFWEQYIQSFQEWWAVSQIVRVPVLVLRCEWRTPTRQATIPGTLIGAWLPSQNCSLLNVYA